MQRINLYQEHLKRRRDPLDARRLALLLILMVVTLGTINAYQVWRASAAEARAVAAESERDAASARVEALQAKLEEQPGGDARRQRMRQELAAKHALLQYLDEGPFGERAGFSRYLGGLSRRVVDGVWLSRIDLAAGGARMRLDGHALEPGHVPALIAALGESAAFQGRSFRRLAMDRPEDADWRIDFVLASEPREGDS